MKKILFVVLHPQRFLDWIRFAEGIYSVSDGSVDILFWINDLTYSRYTEVINNFKFKVINSPSYGIKNITNKKSMKQIIKCLLSSGSKLEPIRSFYNFLLTTPLFDKRLRMQEERYYNWFLGRYQEISKYINKHQVDLFFMEGDRHRGDEPVFLKLAIVLRMPVIIPYLCRFASYDLMLRGGSGTVFLKRKYFVSKYIMESQKNLQYKLKEKKYYYRHYMGNVLQRMGVLTSNPFIMGTGKCTFLCQNSKYFIDKYIKEEVSSQKLLLVGDVSYDSIYKAYLQKDELKQVLIKKYFLEYSRKLVIIALPQWFEHGFISWSEQVKHVNFIVESVCRLGQNVFISLHPKMAHERYHFLESKYSCVILRERLADVLPVADMFIASYSSTVLWAVLCGIPTIVVDFIKLNDSSYDFLSSIKIVKKNHFFHTHLVSKLNQPVDFSSDWKNLSRDDVFDGCTMRRYLDIINKTMGRTQISK
jgi:hypothetical protein